MPTSRPPLARHTAPAQVPPLVTRSMTLKRLPPFPPLLRAALFAARFLPGITLVGLAVTLHGPNPGTIIGWMGQVYGITPDGYALTSALFALFSLLWAGFPGALKLAPTVHFTGSVALTFPLMFYVACTVYYVLVVAPDTPRNALWLYSIGYATKIALLALDAGLRLWFLALADTLADDDHERERGAWTD